MGDQIEVVVGDCSPFCNKWPESRRQIYLVVNGENIEYQCGCNTPHCLQLDTYSHLHISPTDEARERLLID